MADLGTLFFGVQLKDMTDDDRERIRKRLEGMGITLNVEVNRKALYDSVNSALKDKKFTVDVGYNMESAKKAYIQAMEANKTTAGDVRAARIATMQAESEARLALLREKAINLAGRNAMEEAKLAYIRERTAGQTARNELTEIRLDNARKRAIATQYGQINAIRETSNQLRSQNKLWEQAKSYAGMYFSLYAAQRFVRSLVDIRGELDMQLVSLKAILQSEDDAMRIFSQIKNLAIVSPFQVGDLISYTKQLSAFQIPYNELFDTTKRLADLSAGLGVDMSRIILAYGQVRSAAFLRGQEVRQFTEAGIPLIGALADKFTELEGSVVSAGEVFERISKREVSFEMVKSVIEDLTNEGGKFYNMQEKVAQSIKGLYKNLADNFTLMMNSIGEANDDTLKGVAKGLTSIMQNWQEYYKALKAIIAIYGTYKAVIIAATVRVKALNMANHIKTLYSLHTALEGATKSTVIFNSALNLLKSNPLILIASGAAAVAGAFILFDKEAKPVSNTIEDLNSAIESYINVADKSQNRIYKLLKTYDELRDKTNLNEEEQSILNKTIQSLSNSVPTATTEFDKFGKALDINRGKVDEYIKSLEKLNEEQLESEKSKIDKRIDFLQQRIDSYNKAIKEGEYIPGKVYDVATGKEMPKTRKPITEAEREEYIKEIEKIRLELEKLIPVSARAGQALYKNFGAALDKSMFSDQANEWNKLVENIPNIPEKMVRRLKVSDYSVDFKEFRNNIIETYKKQKDELDENLRTFKASPSIITQEDIDESKEIVKWYKIAVDMLGGVEEKEEKRDKYIDSLKREVDLIRSAQSEYEKLRKVMDDEAAMTKLKETSVFSGIDEAYLKEGGVEKLVSDYLTKIGKRSTDAAKDLKKSLEQFGLGDFIKNLEKNLKKADDAMSKYLSDNKDKWESFRNYIQKGLPEEMAMQLAFGGMTEYSSEVEELKNKLESEMERIKIVIPLDLDENEAKEKFGSAFNSVFLLWKEVVKKMEDESRRWADQLADYMSKGLTLQQKLNSATQQRDKEVSRAEVEFGVESPEALAVMKYWEEEISKLQAKLFELSPEFKRFFVETVNMSSSQLRSLSQELKDFINQVENTKEAISFDEGGNPLRYKAFVDGREITISAELLDKLIKQNEKLEKKSDGLTKSFHNLWKAIKGNPEEGYTFEKISEDIAVISDAAADATGKISDMFDAMGKEDLSEAFSFASDALNSVSNISQAFSKGTIEGIFAVVGETANWIGKIFSARDSKLQKTIERSQEHAKTLQYTYDLIERILERFLGTAGVGTSFVPEGIEDDIKNAEKYAAILVKIESLQSKSKLSFYENFELQSAKKQAKELEKYQKRKEAYEKGGAYGYQRQLMIEQLAELEKQLSAEEGKKKSNQATIDDYKAQIAELKIEISEFAESVAESLYGIDLKGWASELGDALFEAWKSGEDGAEAFKNKVGDIMGDVVNEILKVRILEPAMKKIQDLLFGTSGNSGLFGQDFTLDEDDVKKLAGELMGISANVEKYYGALDDVFGYLKKNYGIDLQSGSSKASNAISGISEDQYNLIISYMNSIRADGSVRRDFMRRIVEELMPQTNLIANAQLQQLSMIQRNTAENARSAEEIRLLLSRVVNGDRIRI